MLISKWLRELPIRVLYRVLDELCQTSSNVVIAHDYSVHRMWVRFKGFSTREAVKIFKTKPGICDFFGAMLDKHLSPQLTGKSAGKDSICGTQKPNKHNWRRKNNHIINALMQIKIKQSPTETCANFSDLNRTIYFST